MTGEPSPLLFDDRGGDDEGGERDEYASESEGMVRPEAERSCGGEGGVSLDMVAGKEQMVDSLSRRRAEVTARDKMDRS